MHVLWLDDEPWALKPFVDQLKEAGANVVQFTNNADALRYIDNKPQIDILIQDLMHGHDTVEGTLRSSNLRHFYRGGVAGVEFLEHFRSKFPTTPVVIFSIIADAIDTRVTEDHNLRVVRKMDLGPHEFADLIFGNSEFSETLYERSKAGSNKDVQGRVQAVQVFDFNFSLLGRLARYPNEVHGFSSRDFERLVAKLLRDDGFEVHLTQTTRDGGADILARSCDRLGRQLILIECKKYRPDRSVGVELVRSLYGVKQAQKATRGVLVTTSYFTQPARDFQNLVPYELSLSDYEDLRTWLQKYLPIP